MFIAPISVCRSLCLTLTRVRNHPVFLFLHVRARSRSKGINLCVKSATPAPLVAASCTAAAGTAAAPNAATRCAVRSSALGIILSRGSGAAYTSSATLAEYSACSASRSAFLPAPSAAPAPSPTRRLSASAPASADPAACICARAAAAAPSSSCIVSSPPPAPMRSAARSGRRARGACVADVGPRRDARCSGVCTNAVRADTAASSSGIHAAQRGVAAAIRPRTCPWRVASVCGKLGEKDHFQSHLFFKNVVVPF